MNRSDLQDSSSDEDSLCGIGKTDGESRREGPLGAGATFDLTLFDNSKVS